MRPRIFPTAQAELEQINVTLRRAYPTPARRRAHTFTVAHIIFICGVLLVPIVVTPWPWGRMAADPLSDAKLNNAPPPVKVDPMADSIRNNAKTAEFFRQHRITA